MGFVCVRHMRPWICFFRFDFCLQWSDEKLCIYLRVCSEWMHCSSAYWSKVATLI